MVIDGFLINVLSREDLNGLNSELSAIIVHVSRSRVKLHRTDFSSIKLKNLSVRSVNVTNDVFGLLNPMTVVVELIFSSVKCPELFAFVFNSIIILSSRKNVIYLSCYRDVIYFVPRILSSSLEGLEYIIYLCDIVRPQEQKLFFRNLFRRTRTNFSLLFFVNINLNNN